jgi:uncharacterized delta-60 repeat protein
VRTKVGPGLAVVSALVQQPDGKLVAAGDSTVAGSGLNIKRTYLAVARYNTDGSLDRTFGHGGIVTASIGKFTSGAALVRQPDGKLVVACVSGTDNSSKLTLMRYTGDGGLDPAFGHSGIVTTAVGGGITLNAISALLVRQPDGKLVAFTAGYRHADSYFVLVRYKADGTLDSGYGHGGVVTTRINTFDYFPSAIVQQPDGKLVAAAGTSSAQTWGGIVLVRYNPDGSLDNSFGHGGTVTAKGTTDNDTYAGLALLGHGDLVAAGAGSYQALALHAYNKNGTPDARFGRHGKVTTVLSHVGGISYDGALIASPDGKLLVAGEADLGQSPGNPASFLLRYNSNGSLDSSFAHHGGLATEFAAGGLSGALFVQHDGKIVVAGTDDNSFALARFDSNGRSLDTSFGK